MSDKPEWATLIAATDWSSVSHAYGEAADVPDLLNACLDDPEAPWEAAGSLIHQGSLYTATPLAMPILARLAADPACASPVNCVRVIDFFGSSVAEGRALTDPHSGVAGAVFDRACREAVTECARLVAPLARRADGELRRAVVDACSWLDAPDEQITALLTEAAGSGDDPMLRASALLGLGRQGALRPSLREAALTGGEPVERFAAAWSGIVLERGDSPELIEVLVAEWEQAEELTEQVRISDPATTIAALTSPWPLVDALITAGGDPAMAAAEVLRLRLEVPADRALVRERAEKLSRNADPGIRTRSISLLAATGDTAGARAVAGSLITTPTGRLDSGQLAALLTAAHEGVDPAAWLPALVGHLAATTAPAMDQVKLEQSTSPLPSAMRWAKVPCTPELLAQARRHLAAAVTEADQLRQRPISWAALVAEWGADARAAAPELVAAIPYAPNPCATALAQIDHQPAIGPLAEAFRTAADPSWLGMALTRLTRDGTWCESALASGRVHVQVAARVLRVWAEHPTPGLIPACWEIVDAELERSFPGRRKQLEAVRILHLQATPPALGGVLGAIVDAGGETAGEATALAQELGIAITRNP